MLAHRMTSGSAAVVASRSASLLTRRCFFTHAVAARFGAPTATNNNGQRIHTAPMKYLNKNNASAAMHTAAASSSSSASPSPSSSSASSTPLTGGWYGHLSDYSVIRITSTSSTAPATELLKYLHNLSTIDIYGMIAQQAAANDAAASTSSDAAPYPISGHSMFLNAKGRVLFSCSLLSLSAASDSWLRLSVSLGAASAKGPAGVAKEGALAAQLASNPPPSPAQAGEERGFYAIVPVAAMKVAMQHFNQYNLRRKVKVEDVGNEMQVWQIIPFQLIQQLATANASSTASFSCTPSSLSSALDLSSSSSPSAALASVGLRSCFDPRAFSMGVQTLVAKGNTPVLPSSFSLVPSTSSLFSSYRLLQGFPSFPLDIQSEKSLPLELNLHLMGGVRDANEGAMSTQSAAQNAAARAEITPSVSFNKGCYLGQELTARTFFQGQVRKRVWSAYIAPADSKIKKGLTIQQSIQQERTTSSLPLPSASSLAALSADPLKQLQLFFPFFDPSHPALPTDTPIVRRATGEAATTTATIKSSPPPPPSDAADPDSASSSSSSVSRVLSSSHNLLLAMLRTEHVEDDAQQLIVTETTDKGNAEQQIIPFQPNWWTDKSD